MKETEIKLKVASVSGILDKLKELGFVSAEGRKFEENWMFDFPDMRLRKDNSLLRLRKQGSTSMVTFKGPSEGTSRYKVREEMECAVSDGEAIRQIILALGFQEVFRYQKWRTEFRSDQDPEGHTLLDETPIGNYLELEGSPEWIDRNAARLGFSVEDYIGKSYLLLFLEACAEKGSRPTSMLFESTTT
jgi:adenylate cyclase class 2